MSSVNLKDVIGARLKQARSALGMTQKEWCEASGMKLPSLRDYELCKRIPGGEALSLYARAGINLNWLLTGEGNFQQFRLQADVTAPDSLPSRVLGTMVLGEYKDHQLRVAEAAKQVQFDIPILIRDALVAALIGGMSPDALTSVMAMLKAQHQHDTGKTEHQPVQS